MNSEKEKLEKQIKECGTLSDDKMFIEYSKSGIRDLVELVQQHDTRILREFVDRVEPLLNTTTSQEVLRMMLNKVIKERK